MGILSKGEYTLCEFGEESEIIGEYDECREYVAEHGGTFCTQVDCDEYVDSDGEKAAQCYVEGNRYVNRTGVYGVI